MDTHETAKLISGAGLKHNKLWKFRLTKETIIGEQLRSKLKNTYDPIKDPVPI